MIGYSRQQVFEKLATKIIYHTMQKPRSRISLKTESPSKLKYVLNSFDST